MRKNPGFAATALLTLAIGIGANTAIFTVVRAVLLKPLAYPDPDRLVRLSGGATLAHFEQCRTASRSFSEGGAFAVGLENMSLSGGAHPEMLKGARVSANFLHILGVRPVLGRGFLPAEDMSGAPPVALISTHLWMRRFSGNPSILGSVAMLAATPYTIVGVLPADFQFPFPGLDVWVTKPSEWSAIPVKSSPLSPILNVFGRLKPHVTLQQAAAELVILNHQYALAHPAMLDAKPNKMAQLRPLKDDLVSNVRAKLWMLFGAVGFVLLIACANVASLLLARAASRSREFAVRAAIGAGRMRLIAQLLAESLLLAVCGGVAGVLLAKWCLNGITSVTALDLPRAEEIHLDIWVLGFAAALTIATGVLFGLAPSLGASRVDLVNLLRGSSNLTGAAISKRMLRRWNTRSLLVIGQIALSLVLLIGATLLMESMTRLRGINPGFQSSNLLTMRIALPPARYDTERKKAAFFRELVQRIESLPGVLTAAITLTLPTTGWAGSPVQVAERAPVRLNERPIAILQTITPEYFRTLKIRLKRGREFTAHDTADSAFVAIINETLARRFWPEYPNGRNPIGEHILIGAHPEPVEIVGIAADVRQGALDSDPLPGMYRPYSQVAPQSAMLAVRTQGDPLRFVGAVRHQVSSIDREQPISEVKTMDDVLEESEGQRRLTMLLLACFAATAVLLTAVGLYGVIAYSIVQRTKEVGIRRALGAQRSDILSLVVTQGLGLAFAGVAIGIGAAFALTRILSSLLFEISPTDPATFVVVSLGFVVVALAASLLPARRATRIDPMAALRIS
jgi:predicted permease